MTVAITGGIAEGKSTLIGWLGEEGWPVCSADTIAREVLEGHEVYVEICQILHEAGFPAPGTLNPEPRTLNPEPRTLNPAPETLRKAMLSSAQVRRAVNRVLHPKIFSALKTRNPEPGTRNPTFIEVPLAIEACLQTAYDRLWVARCGPEVQRTRMQQRYGDPELIDALLSTQLGTEVKCVFADRIFRTNEPESTVRASLIEAARELSV